MKDVVGKYIVVFDHADSGLEHFDSYEDAVKEYENELKESNGHKGWYVAKVVEFQQTSEGEEKK
ncbi:hypothetical protein [Terribacillus saccharophilus]|uniref:hypothetical protein n=1 Tax=Terribacillus saccharophilus TaxID=361277 RepID=UPI000BA58994|nr:hypothetical protein [Terribacillus saccharophilus]PAF19737.1 hypothetical protein CHH51_01355 [Terribacillus saccharophilus]